MADWVEARLAQMPNLKYVPVISNAEAEDQWTGRTGFVHQAVLQDFPDLSGYQVYACGAPVVIDAAQRDYAQHGLAADAFFEVFGLTHIDNHLFRIEVFVYSRFVRKRLQYIGKMCGLHSTKLRGKGQSKVTNFHMFGMNGFTEKKRGLDFKGWGIIGGGKFPGTGAPKARRHLGMTTQIIHQTLRYQSPL